MIVSALCALDWTSATRPLVRNGVLGTSPPLRSGSRELDDFLALASGSDILVINLHGYDGVCELSGQWDGLAGPVALSAQDIGHDWDGTVIFMEVCFSGAGGKNAGIPNAFMAGGARAIIASTTEAYGRVRRTLPLPGFDGEADRLAQFFVAAYHKRRDPHTALAVAQRYLRMWSWPLDKEDRATLDSFKIYQKETAR